MHGASADGAFDRDELRGMSPLRLATKDCISQLLLTRPKVHGSASLTSDFSTCTWVCRVAGIGCSTCSCSGRSWKAPLEQLQWDLKTQVQRDQVALPCEKEGGCLSMASSSSCSSSIQTRSGPVDGDVLWMQPKHVLEHVWNGEPDRKLHIRRPVPTYQGEEQILEEIVPLLRQCGFYWIMKMGYLKINAALISAFIERWRPETHTFHLRCGEATITLQDVSILLGLRTDGAPLIGSTNLDWADLCEELLGVRPQEGEIEGSVVKLSWLAHYFSHINIDEGNVEQLQRFIRAWILRFIGGVIFVNKSSSRVSLSTYAWGPAMLAYLYREMCSTTDYKVKSIGSMCILIQMWTWERCTTLAPKRTPPVIENKPLGHRWLRRGNQHIGNDDLRVFRRKLDLMKRHEFVWEPYTPTVMAALPPICVVGSVVWFAVVPLICFHVVEWHQPDRVLRQYGLQQPIPRCPSQPQNLHGITLKGKQDENWFHLLAPIISQWNDAAQFRVDVYPRQEGLLGFNSDYMVWYRRHHTDTSASEHSFGGVAETQAHFSWPTMTPSQQHDAPMATPNAPFASQWNVPRAIPDMGDLLGVDLCQEFSAEAKQAEAGRQRGRRNPDRQARRWDRPCGTSSRHRGHHND
ncbi:Serine/threonine-protein phosphatase 7 long form [Glycine max]|nr:Serine/threonine-protein phosphatase 7 long form [Glycine max]